MWNDVVNNDRLHQQAATHAVGAEWMVAQEAGARALPRATISTLGRRNSAIVAGIQDGMIRANKKPEARARLGLERQFYYLTETEGKSLTQVCQITPIKRLSAESLASARHDGGNRAD